MTTLALRAATTDDIPALVVLVTSAYRGDASRTGWTSEADLIDGERIDAAALEADLSRDRSIILLAERGDQLVACAHVADVGGKALWTKELDHALGNGEIDCSVHSMKDVETLRPEQFILAAMLERADIHDRLSRAAVSGA